MRQILIFVLCAMALSGCTSKLKRENEALAGQIAQRREALRQRQQQGLDEARRDLALTDSLLALATRQHDELHQWVMEHAAELPPQAPQVERLNLLRARRDSLKERFEVLAETIKYIKQRQKE